MGLIDVHLHDPEFNFAPFSNQGPTPDTGEDESERGAANNELYFPNDESESGGLGGLLVLVVFVVAALAVRKLMKGTEDLEDFGEDTEE